MAFVAMNAELTLTLGGISSFAHVRMAGQAVEQAATAVMEHTHMTAG